jgi:hypothetical protein
VIAIAFAAFTGVVIVCVTLVTRWALRFAQSTAAVAVDELEDDQELLYEMDEDPAVLSIKHLDGWDEIVFEGRRYRRCLNSRATAYHSPSIGWLHYPEGTPPEHWLPVQDEYERRMAVDESSRIAAAARKTWEDSPRPRPRQRLEDEVGQESHLQNNQADLLQQREEELDRLVEKARSAMGKSD